MKKVEFTGNRRWDAYKAFHQTKGEFTLFENGECMLTRAQFRPHQRRMYPELGVQIVATNDDNLPQLYMDEARTQPVKKAWLNASSDLRFLDKRQQFLVVDYEQGVAIRIGRGSYGRRSSPLQHVPDHLSSACALWMGPHRKPVPLSKIEVAEPDPELKKQLRPKLRDVKAAAGAIRRISDDRPVWTNDKMRVNPEWLDMSVEEIIEENFAGPDWWFNRARAANGFEFPRKTSTFEYLYTERRGV